jgi:hypothetical protein
VNGGVKAAYLPDILYVSLCLTGAFISLGLFWFDLNLTLSRLTEQPVGIISYKYRASQRRFNDRLLWERLKQESTVFDGDYIRTAALSEATISFLGEDKLSPGGSTGRAFIGLEENTLIQILLGGSNIVLTEGGLSVDARTGNVSISAGAARINVLAGSVVHAAAFDGEVDMRVLQGSAEIQRGAERRTVAAGEMYSTAGTARLAVLSPGPAAKFLNNTQAPLRVSFRWDRIGFTGNEAILLDVAEDRSFSRIVQTVESRTENAAVYLENGIYYWRVYARLEANAEIKRSGVSGRLSVIYAPAPVLLRPEQDQVFSFKTSRPGVRFHWTGSEGASAYLVEVSANRNIQNPVFRTQVQETRRGTVSIVHSGFEPGTYYWRVTPVYPRDYTGTGQVSGIASFHIERTDTLAVPELQARQGELYLDSEQENSYFTWQQEEEAASYTFLLSQKQDLSNPIIEQKVKDNYYAFDVKAAGLAPGQYYWGVYQTDIEGNNSVVSQSRTIVVIAGVPPARSPAAPPLPAVVMPAAPDLVSASMSAAPPPPAESLPEPPIPPLPAPLNLLPDAGYVLTTEIIIRDRRIEFSWEAVSEASEYIFTIYQAAPGGYQRILRPEPQEETFFTLTDLAVLDRGDFVWQVEAVNRSEGRPGEIAESRFTVNIEEVGTSQGNESGVMFGRE